MAFPFTSALAYNLNVWNSIQDYASHVKRVLVSMTCGTFKFQCRHRNYGIMDEVHVLMAVFGSFRMLCIKKESHRH